jgi:hypothetical protein
MYDKLLKLKENKKWLYYLLLVPIVVLGILELYNKYLVSSAKSAVKDAEKKDNDLEKKQIKAEQAAESHEEEAKNIEKNINSQKIDKKWHLQ